MFGPALPRYAEVGDATLVEAVPLVVMLIATVVVGIYPALLTDVFSVGLTQ